MSLSSRVYVVAWLAVILLGVVPWRSFDRNAHWDRVRWIPFVSRPRRVLDVVGNVLLYVPFGYWYVGQARDTSHKARRAVALAALLSVATEASQLYSRFRFPSLTDVTCNVFGAWCGALAAERRFVRRM